MLFAKNAQRYRDRERIAPFDDGYRGANALEQLRRRPTHRNHDAELGGTSFVSVARRLDEPFDGTQRLGLNVRGEARALRAEIAILRAAAFFRVVQHLHRYGISAIDFTHFVRERE